MRANDLGVRGGMSKGVRPAGGTRKFGRAIKIYNDEIVLITLYANIEATLLQKAGIATIRCYTRYISVLQKKNY